MKLRRIVGYRGPIRREIEMSPLVTRLRQQLVDSWGPSGGVPKQSKEQPSSRGFDRFGAGDRHFPPSGGLGP